MIGPHGVNHGQIDEGRSRWQRREIKERARDSRGIAVVPWAQGIPKVSADDRYRIVRAQC